MVSNVSKRGHSAHNERYHDVEEYERKVRKRRARLITATEESFTHIRRMRETSAGETLSPLSRHWNFNLCSGSRKQPLSPYEAAQAVFPSLSRSLQKYLRVTRQQPRHTMESILQHLSTCLSYDMSPRAFLEKYIVTSPVLQVSDPILMDYQSQVLLALSFSCLTWPSCCITPGAKQGGSINKKPTIPAEESSVYSLSFGSKRR